ncbi:uncharacterized protein N7515_005287 [Penicillium bovifimosum]|uniref:Uncharacterized protein n=1 Tax=Penicillium bovifimosum TaxID=126998 RepID=A0A9W9GSU1_9EURO|nr:uncharacterized protein N7515_005287 [Penicillium bovifimosum]KAJ5129248.1 hypothetical protein N7515_005287 [Penicillium bovifimosum]
MASTNFCLQDLPRPILWILLVLWISSVTFVVERCMIRVGQAAIVFQVFRIIHYCFYQTQDDEFFAQIFSARLELKTFVLQLCLPLTVHSLFKEVIGVLRERVIAPFNTTIVDCPDCQPSYLPRLQHARQHKKQQVLPPKSQEPQQDVKQASDYLNKYMRHPWGVVDYYILLANIERGRDKNCRVSECCLVETDGLKQVALHDYPSFENVPCGMNPTVFFVTIPVPNAHNEFTNAKLVLGFDLTTRCFQGYLFEVPQELNNYQDLWRAYMQGAGKLVIDVHIERFLTILRHTMRHRIEILELGMLHHNSMTTRAFQAGMDMLISIQFLQFAEDFADLMWEDAEGVDSWFSVRDGLTLEKYRQKQVRSTVTSGLFYGQSIVGLRDHTEQRHLDGSHECGDSSRLVQVIAGRSESVSKAQVPILVSVMVLLCIYSILNREMGALPGRL